MLDWNDLKYFVAVARHGSTVAAGHALKVDQSTVQRRLAALERQIGRPLVQRLPTGYRLTPFGEEMLPHAQHVERAVLAFEQQMADSTRNAAGVIRLTCPEPLVDRLTRAGLLDRFHARHPAFRVEFVMSDKYLDLRKGDADVALHEAGRRMSGQVFVARNDARSGRDLLQPDRRAMPGHAVAEIEALRPIITG
jgi:DNA-binding transcriptional LysR family regulator